MTLTASTLADIRSRANFMPYCCLCSLRVGTKEQILNGPSLRTVPFAPSRDYPQGRNVVKVQGCCRHSQPPDEDNYFDDEASASQWWRQARLLEVGPLGDEMRRRRTLERLAAANLEAIE